MTEIQLGYGRDSIPINFDPRKFSLLSIDSSEPALTDVEIGEALDSPIGSAPLDDLIRSEDSILIVVSDATRATGSAQIVNLVVRRLIQCGVSPGELAIIFATGIHRPVSEQEKVELLTPFIVQRVRTLIHDAYDSQSCTSLGVTERGIRVEVNKALTDFSKIILIGGINFHYFAGFTGGRKSVCPGLASASTIKQTHMLALDFEKGGRRAGVGVGLLDGNPVHEECERVAELVNPTFGINTIVDENNRIVNLHCGDWRLAHRAACETYLHGHSVEIRSKRDVVVVSCGGFPHDINLIQAHKALEMASYACKDGGTILLVAQCRDGLGRTDFLKWFESPDSIALENRLRENYEVNGQTAWSLLTKAERFHLYFISDLSDEDVRRMRMIPFKSVDEALQSVRSFENGFILPRGAGILPRLANV
jgi:nickel-dependent lactate racemase